MMKHAFTLAETLIVIMIIGVVAAMTIPTLISNHQKRTNVIKLKKFYSTFIQVLKKSAYYEGCDSDMECYYEIIGVTGNNNTSDRVQRGLTSITKQLSNITLCDKPVGTGFSTGMCTEYNFNKNYDGSGTNSPFYYNIIMPDGMYVGYFVSGSSSNGGWTVVDINGQKGPNREGRDIFTFWNYLGNQILPPVSNDNCTDENKYGQSCASRIIKNNWVMDY